MLKDAIAKNRRRDRYRRLHLRLVKRVFEYEDAGKKDKYDRIIEKVRKIGRICLNDSP